MYDNIINPINKFRLLKIAVLILLLVPSLSYAQQDADVLFEAMQLEEGDWAADVGSREGTYALPMASLVGNSGRVFAVDIDEEALGTLNKKIKDERIRNITTVSSVYDNPMLPVNSFDAVLVRNAYHEFTEHTSMLRHIRSALKPVGRLVMAEYIGDDVIDDDRSTQVEDHELALRYARKEVQNAGFKIANEVNAIRDGDDWRFWMLVVTPREPE